MDLCGFINSNNDRGAGMNTFGKKTVTAAMAAAILGTTAGPALGAKLDVVFDDDDFNWATAADITNPYWPLGSGGNSYAYFSESDDGCAYNLVTVTATTKSDFANDYIDVVARAVTDLEWLDEDCDGNYVLTEKTTDWYAQDIAGNIWYFGEDTEAYDDEEECPSSAGAWEAGVDGAEAGIVMLANPAPGVAYQQEFDEGNAEDQGKVTRLNASISIDWMGYESGPVCLKTKEWTALEPGNVEHKFYCKVSDGGVGLMLINELKGKTVRVEYIGPTLPAGDFPMEGECPI